jgi:hypothetical protein
MVKRLFRSAQSNDPEKFRDDFFKAHTSLWGSRILLVDDIQLQIRYLKYTNSSNVSKVNATRYNGFHEKAAQQHCASLSHIRLSVFLAFVC